MTDVLEVLEEKLVNIFYEEYRQLDILNDDAIEQRQEIFEHLFGELSTSEIGEIILSDPIMKEEYLSRIQKVDVFYQLPEMRFEREISDKYKAIILQRVGEASTALEREQLDAAYVFLNNDLIKSFERRLSEILETEPECKINELVDNLVQYLQA